MNSFAQRLADLLTRLHILLSNFLGVSRFLEESFGMKNGKAVKEMIETALKEIDEFQHELTKIRIERGDLSVLRN